MKAGHSQASIVADTASDPFSRDVWAVLGMPIDNLTVAQAAARIEHAVATRQRLSFVTPNVNWLIRAKQEPQAMRQIVQADLSLADGAPIVWLARRLGMPLKQRCAGSDLFAYLHSDRRPNIPAIRIFFFGGREGAGEAACKRLDAEGGRLVSAGWYNPGFGDLASMSTPDILNTINAAQPDFILVSLGAAKGQAWIEVNQSALEAPVLAHLGAVVDFVAGTIRRAPPLVSRLGLEWVWRIAAEPALWKRYWKDGRALLSLCSARLQILRRASVVDCKTCSLKTVLDTGGSEACLHLMGDAVVQTRETLRAGLRQLVAEGGAVSLNLSGVRALDASAIGQLRMLEQIVLRRDGELKIEVGSALKSIMAAAGFYSKARPDHANTN